MRVLGTVVISVLVFLAMYSFIPSAEECEIYNSTIRLHVIANSDTDEDQELKLKVRDALLDKITTLEASNKAEALLKIESSKDELVEIAEQAIKSNGKAYPVSIEIGLEDYPTRYYEDFSLPAGSYTSVQVKIGEGSGQNWWCVLYPPLCTASAIDFDEDTYIEVGLTKDQYNLITGNNQEYKIKFKLLEFAEEVFKTRD